jgi:hypothetical protein
MANDEYTLSHQEVVKAILIDQHIHEGLWTLNIDFHVETSHAPRVHDPTLTVAIKGVGIMRAPPTDPFAVDAALINPMPSQLIEEAAQRTAQADSSHQGANGSMQFCRDAYRHIAVQSAIKTRSKIS